jgi:hypothetical protein
VLAAHEVPCDVVQHRCAGEIDVDVIESDERRESHRVVAVFTEPREFTRD